MTNFSQQGFLASVLLKLPLLVTNISLTPANRLSLPLSRRDAGQLVTNCF